MTSPERVSPEVHHMNEWFPLLPLHVRPGEEAIQPIWLWANPGEVNLDSPLATKAVPIRVVGYPHISDAAKRNILLTYELPLDPGLGGYVVNRQDFTFSSRMAKKREIEAGFNTDLARKMPLPADPLYSLSIELLAKEAEDFTVPDNCVPAASYSTLPILEPRTVAYLSRARFRIFAPAYYLQEETIATANSSMIYWDSFYSLDAPLLPSDDRGDLSPGQRIAFTPKHLHEWFGIFLEPGVMHVPFPSDLRSPSQHNH